MSYMTNVEPSQIKYLKKYCKKHDYPLRYVLCAIINDYFESPVSEFRILHSLVNYSKKIEARNK